MQFQKATKKMAKARVALAGPSGAGKTYSALIAATVLAQGGQIAVIDTERGSASLYSETFDFDVLELNTYSPKTYTEAIHAAEQAGYAVIVIDSLSHAWEGEGGALDMLDQFAGRSGNQFSAWKDVTPVHRRMVDAMLQSPCHIVVTMRSKMDYVQEKDEKTGKTVIRKVGMNPIQRAGMEYEFTMVVDLDINHKAVVSKSRCSVMDDKSDYKPSSAFWQPFLDWLNSGEAVTSPPTAPEAEGAIETIDKVLREYYRTAEEVIEALRLASKKLYKTLGDKPPATNQFTLFVSLLSQLADHDDTYRITFLREVWQIKESSKELSMRQVEATLDWIDPEEYTNGDGKKKYRVGNPEAQAEFNRVVTAAMQRDMTPLPGMAEEER